MTMHTADGAQAPAPKVIPPDQTKTISQLYGEGLPESFRRPDLYAEGEIGRCLQFGDEAIRKGNLEEAKGHFEEADRLIRETGYDRRLRQHRDLALDRFDLVVDAQALSKSLAVSSDFSRRLRLAQ